MSIRNRRLLEAVEGCLSALGALQPRYVRSKGGVPKSAKSVIADVEALYEAFSDEAIGAVKKTSGGSMDWSEDEIDAAIEALGPRLEQILADAVDKAIQDGLEDAAALADDPDIVFTKVDPGLVEALRGQAVNLSESTAAKIRGEVKRELLESARLGEGYSQAVARIKGISSLSDYEAERIVKTEMATAANAARLQGYKGRLSHVVWVLGPAYKGGCACADLAGVYALSEAMGLKMPLHPNCDCYWRPATEAEVAEAA